MFTEEQRTFSTWQWPPLIFWDLFDELFFFFNYILYFIMLTTVTVFYYHIYYCCFVYLKKIYIYIYIYIHIPNQVMLKCVPFYVEILNNINSMFITDLHSSRNLLSPACKQPSPIHPPWRLGESCRNKLLQNKYWSFVATERTVFLSIHYYFKTAPDKQTSSWQIMWTLSRLCKTISCRTNVTGV